MNSDEGISNSVNDMHYGPPSGEGESHDIIRSPAVLPENANGVQRPQCHDCCLAEPGPEQQTIMCSHYTSHNNCEHINCEQLFVRSVKMVASPAAC